MMPMEMHKMTKHQTPRMQLKMGEEGGKMRKEDDEANHL
jgi:hypothetical protein